MAHLMVTALLALLIAADLAFSGWFLWGPLLARPSATPGARDGMGLLVMFCVWLFSTGIFTAILASIQVWLLKSLLPWWEPPDPGDF